MKQNILVIEENIAMRYLLTTVLNKEYSTVVPFDCYEAAIDLKTKDIQLIIVNIDDVNTQNFEFLLHLNSSSLYSDIPVIVVSNNVSNEFRLRCLEIGVEAFFLKPFDPLVLLECIKVNLYLSENMSQMHQDINFELKYKIGLSN